MSDNITVTPGTGATIAAESLSGALVQRVKLAIGATDVDGGNVSATNPMPVLSGTAANFLVQASGTVTAVSGTAANLLAQVSGSVTAVSGTAANMLSQVSQGTAANLQVTATVTAGTAIMGQVISGQQMSVYNGTAAVTVQYASVSFATSLGNTVITGVANKNIYVLGGVIIAQGATNLQFWSNTTASTAITGVMACTANMGFQIPYCPVGNFVTQGTGQPIQLASSAAVTIGGWLTYVAY